MILALKALYFIFWLCLYSFAIELIINSIFPRLKLKYFDYLSLLTVGCILVSLAEMVWELGT